MTKWLDEDELLGWLEEEKGKYKSEDLTERMHSVLNEASMTEKAKKSGKDAFLRWKLLKEMEWIEQDKYINDIDKEITGLKARATVMDGEDRLEGRWQELFRNPAKKNS